MPENRHGFEQNRYKVVYAFILIIAVVIIYRLFSLQIINGEEYREISDSRLARSIPIKAPRGEILDRYGRAMVKNRVGYSVSISKIDDDKSAMNKMLLSLYELAKEENLDFEDTLPISENAPFSFTFGGDTSEERLKKEADFRVAEGLKAEVTAEDIINKYIKKYDISEEYSPEEIRKICGMRYAMEKRNFSSNNPYTFLKDVDITLVTRLKEQRDKFPYISVYAEPVREYVGGTLAAHILGRTGIINADEYATLQKEGYGMNDYLGKQGVEKVFEKYLRGTDGVNSLERKIKGAKSELVYSRDPVPGNSVVLTIDSELQKATEKSLEYHIKNIAATSKYGDGHDANAGAAVAIDVKTGEILALASYPTYDPLLFNKNYNKMLTDPARPMFNRALSGAYEPGSTYKPAVAVAALEEELLKSKETITDQGIYKYLGHDFACWIFRQSGGTHGAINVSQGLQHSCNYFFYELGKRLGIDSINKYSKMFGLGSLTGIELSDEEQDGQLANPDLREKNGGTWYPGDVLQAAIGQSDNLFTPIQLANYTATLANGGKLYNAHLLKSIKSNTTHEIIEEKDPIIRSNIEIKKENYDAVLEGMRLVAAEGTASGVFANFPVTTAGKTGSAQVSRGSANGIYIGFAPFDDPQIAVAVVVEHGGSGGKVSYIGRDIFDEYFFGGEKEIGIDNIKQENVLLQ